MTGQNTGTKRLRGVLIALMLATTAGLAGCVGEEPQEADDDENLVDEGDDQPLDDEGNETADDADDADAEAPRPTTVEEAFTVPEEATGFTLNLTVNPIGDEVTNATVQVLDPRGTVVATENVTFTGDEPANVNITVGGENETAEFIAGEYEFTVQANDRITVTSQITLLGMPEEETAA